jgi:aryl-alcohol dehydrogenase-like predicted oxidoreductase
MEYVNLGNSGLKISRICLGAMQFGNTAPWMVELDGAVKVWKKAWDLGINCRHSQCLLKGEERGDCG